ncbi:MAG: hypothetical protein RLZ84_653, partial [Actinomycetota bacterium]
LNLGTGRGTSVLEILDAVARVHGSTVPHEIVERRLGDVALVASSAVSFEDPADSGPFDLVCRHGSLTADEMYVPFLAAEV